MQYAQFLDVWIKSLPPTLVKEGLNLANRQFDRVMSHQRVSMQLEKLWTAHSSHGDKTKLSLFYAMVLSRIMKWESDATLEKIASGVLIKDIALSNKADCLDLIEAAMTPEQLADYKQHPKRGVMMLDDLGYSNEAVKQIVFQHHEYCNGSGFPSKLSGQKIYALARLVTFVSDLAEMVNDKQVSPIDGLKKLLTGSEMANRYDADLVRTFLTTIIQGQKG